MLAAVTYRHVIQQGSTVIKSVYCSHLQTCLQQGSTVIQSVYCSHLQTCYITGFHCNPKYWLQSHMIKERKHFLPFCLVEPFKGFKTSCSRWMAEGQHARTQKGEEPQSLRICVKVDLAVLGFPSLIVRTVFVDVKQHRARKENDF